MAFAFDTLAYAKRLRDAGVQPQIAEAQAEAAKDFIMVELATKSDLLSLKSDLLAVKGDLLAVKQELQVSLENMALRLIVGLGSVVVVGIGVLAVLLKP
jgi:outer membrane protein TolC